MTAVAASTNSEELILELFDVLERCPASARDAATDAALEAIAKAGSPEEPEEPEDPDEPLVPDDPLEPLEPEDAAASLVPTLPEVSTVKTVLSEIAGNEVNSKLANEAVVVADPLNLPSISTKPDPLISKIGTPDIGATLNKFCTKSSSTENNWP